MKKVYEDINLNLELERALANGNANQVNEILNLLSKSIDDKDEDTKISVYSFEEHKSGKDNNLPLLTSTNLTHDNIQHSLENALENGDAKMVDYYLFLLGKGV